MNTTTYRAMLEAIARFIESQLADLDAPKSDPPAPPTPPVAAAPPQQEQATDKASGHFNKKELADYLRVSVRTIDRMMKVCGLPYVKLTGKCVRFPRAEVDFWLKQRQVERAKRLGRRFRPGI